MKKRSTSALVIGIILLQAAGLMAVPVYQNEKFGFRLTLKDAWKDYRIQERTTSWSGGIKASTFYFCLRTSTTTWESNTSPAGYAALFAVTVFASEQWKKLISGEDADMEVGDLSVLATTQNYVYTSSIAHAIPEDLRARHDDIAGIMATFKLEK